MNLLDEANSGTPVGGLAAFKVLKDTDLVKTDSSDGDALMSMWQARGGLPFRLPLGKKTNIVFLTDVSFLPVHELAVGERKGQSGKYPLTEVVRSTSILGITPSGETIKSSRTCLLEKVLGRSPKLIAVAKVLDLTSFTTKAGVHVPWTVKTIIIPSNNAVLNTLMATSEANQKDIKNAIFIIQRSMKDKSPKIGDSWSYKKHATNKELLEIDGLSEAAKQVDLDKGFPILEDSDILPMLKRHISLCQKYGAESKNAVLTYDEHAAASVFGGEAPLKETEPAKESSTTTTANLLEDLEDLDDIPTGNPFEQE